MSLLPVYGSENECLRLNFVTAYIQPKTASLVTSPLLLGDLVKSPNDCGRSARSIDGGKLLFIRTGPRGDILTRQSRKAEMSWRNRAAAFFIFGALISQINVASGSNSSSNDTDDKRTPGHKDPPPLKVAKFDFDHVGGPLTIILWILIASLAKLGKVLLQGCGN